jgi:hypothetical protein
MSAILLLVGAVIMQVLALCFSLVLGSAATTDREPDDAAGDDAFAAAVVVVTSAMALLLCFLAGHGFVAGQG